MSTTELLEQLQAAQKYGSLQEIEAKVEEAHRRLAAAEQNAADARVAAADAKAEADKYCQQKKEEADSYWAGTKAVMEKAEENSRLRLANMETNAQAQLETIEAKLTDVRKQLATAINDRDNVKTEWGTIKSAMEDAWNRLIHSETLVGK